MIEAASTIENLLDENIIMRGVLQVIKPEALTIMDKHVSS